jgi:hypothetical protein
MRRLTKVLIVLLFILFLTAGISWLFWRYQLIPLETLGLPEPAVQTVADGGSSTRMTAKNAYSVAEPVALGWANDARLFSARATFDPGSDIRSGEGDWTLVFYSPEKYSTALISVMENKATFINERNATHNSVLQGLDAWQVDSPNVVSQMLMEGGDEFLRSQPGAVLVLSLDMAGQGGWKGRFIHKETRRTFTVQLGAENGEVIAVQQTG